MALFDFHTNLVHYWYNDVNQFYGGVIAALASALSIFGYIAKCKVSITHDTKHICANTENGFSSNRTRDHAENSLSSNCKAAMFSQLQAWKTVR
jgi:hypothetical protein